MVRESRITKGALYFHLRSKEAVAEAIIAEQSEWLVQRLAVDGAPVQKVVDLSYAFVDALRSDPLMRASIRMTIDRAAPPTSVAQGYDSWITAVTLLLDRARTAGSLTERVASHDCAFIITSSITGLQLTSEALSQRRDLSERVRSFWHIILPAIVRPELLRRVDARPPEHRDGTIGSPI